MLRNCSRVSILCATLFFLTSCSLYIFKDPNLYSDPPLLPATPPQLTAIEARPERLIPGRSNLVEIVVSFEDVNTDVGPDEARVMRTIRKISGNFNLSANVKTLQAPVVMSGSKGKLTSEINIVIPTRANGVLEIEISVYDKSGLLSKPLAVKVYFP